MEHAIAALTGLTRAAPLPLEEPGEVVLDLYDTDASDDDTFTATVPSGELRHRAADTVIDASLSDISLQKP